MKKVRTRPRRIPAFGEWNYYDHGGYGYGDGDGDGGNWPVTQYFDSAMQAELFMASPPSPKSVKKAVKWSDSATTLEAEGEQGKQGVVVGLGEHGEKKPGKQRRVSDAGAHATTANYQACSRVVKAVDADLYVIPPDMLCHKPRKRLTRGMWIGCLGLSCIAKGSLPPCH